MSHLEFEQRIKANAYKLFHAEFQKHLETARGCLVPPEPSPEQLKQAGAIFHLVRGGAGFFGLADLAQVSEKLETVLLHDAAQSSKRLTEARKLLQEVEALARLLPEPSEPR